MEERHYEQASIRWRKLIGVADIAHGSQQVEMGERDSYGENIHSASPSDMSLSSLTLWPSRSATCMQDQSHILLQDLVIPVTLVGIRYHSSTLAGLLRVIDNLELDSCFRINRYRHDFDLTFSACFDSCGFLPGRESGDKQDRGLGVFEVERNFRLRVGWVERSGHGPDGTFGR